jgi:hypothetical protein
MKLKINFLTAVMLAAGALTASVTGCELIASVDRSKITGTGGSGGGTGGTGGATTSSSSSSGGGMGGMPACVGGVACTEATKATDCPANTNECVTTTCDMGCCGTSNVAVDTAVSAAGQTAKDCMSVVCDGAGATKKNADVADLPDPMDDCHVGTCSAAGAPGQDVKPSGSACATNGKVCDGAGVCVGCLVDADCTSPNVCDPQGTHVCVPPGCTDGVKNGNETAKDCGGPDCGPCVNGLGCAADTDCVEGNCNGTTCDAATCTDGKIDGVPGALETGPDCGGPCVAQGKTCVNGLPCGANTDCSSTYCDTTGANHLCKQPACNDGVKNGNESAADCGGGAFQGGAVCPKCTVGKVCQFASDCATAFCQNNLCQVKPQGASCGGDAECGTNHCVDGVCCDTGCTGACQACVASKKGGVDGVCGNITANTDPDAECADQGATSCGTNGFCDGAGACAKYAAGTTCRASAGNCDVAETCPGAGAACPADAFQANTVVCRVAAAGGCDVAENCTGTSAACPADAFLPNTTICRMSAGGCDPAENCTGASAACPVDTIATLGTVCRAVAGTCDIAETCNGVSTACPTDAFVGAGTTCRPSAGFCDPAETCTGSAAACPADVLSPAGTAPPAIQTAGDCQKVVCVGGSASSVTTVNDGTDLPPPSGTLCLINPACVGSPLAPTYTTSPTGTDCTADPGSGIVCGDTSVPAIAGTCVGCNTSADCMAPTPTCNTTTHVCQ